MKEKEVHGTFEDVLNKLLTANGLPSFSMGDVTLPKFDAVHTTDAPVPAVDLVISKGANVQSTPSSPSPATPSLARSPVRPLRGRSVKNDIIIHKKKNSAKVTSDTVERMYRDGSLFFDSSSMNATDIIMLLRTDFSIAKVHEHSVRDFNSLLKSRNDQS